MYVQLNIQRMSQGKTKTTTTKNSKITMYKQLRPPPPPRQQNKQFMHSFSTHTIYILEEKNRDQERHF